MKETKIRIAIVDDHQIVIDGIQALLTPYSNFEVVVSTTSSIQVLSLLQHSAVDVLLTDIMMPEMDGQALAKKVREQFASIKIIALSMSGQGNVVSGMINDADINGYVLKNIGKVELATAINKVASGGIYFSDEVLKELQHYTAIKKENTAVNITTRELEIIQLIAQDFSNKKIADHLFISERTVETHRKNIFRKTNTNTVIGLLKYATDHRLL
jgi:two-component system nitrate/nitrite response regulator NarL